MELPEPITGEYGTDLALKLTPLSQHSHSCNKIEVEVNGKIFLEDAICGQNWVTPGGPKKEARNLLLTIIRQLHQQRQHIQFHVDS